ncbi:helix-turn-helix transcriptional regulator [Telluria mixta]|uniref:Helix-turn-helix transcriptional regulator n=1 Tax=Telluria mixta TaxID=34071 RepID=A0ABT2BU97_9BURK|nr:helix-turn-helix transcriptional regulator [Telluria mixta]
MKLLTPRERRVLQAVIANKVRTNKDLAKHLFISESTLRNHLSSIYQKLGVSNRLDLYVYAQNHLAANTVEMA